MNSLQGKSSFRYELSSTLSLHLIKDGRKLTRLRRFQNSPFPFLSNVEFFSCSVGNWNYELKKYGIKTRTTAKDHATPESWGTKIFLVRQDTILSSGNSYLRKQYRRLQHYRNYGIITEYWKLVWKLMTTSVCFRLACLNSWQPRWYKELSLRELNHIWKGLHHILSLSQIHTKIYNVWAESPRGKWRQLGVPPKSWRLYLHMLNQFLSYIYSPKLDSSLYDGFLYNRGCHTWWRDLLWNGILDRYSSIMEVDLSSGFPNLNRCSVYAALKSDGLVPPSIINLIMNYLSSPLVESKTFPTLETYIENQENQGWRQGPRSVHMGLGISPILFVITCRWAMSQINLLTPQPGEFTFKSYADDFSFYFNLKWFYTFYRESGESLLDLLTSLSEGQNPILNYLNKNPLLQTAGIKFCPQKSGLVRIWGFWLKPYKSLGLCLYTTQSLSEQILNWILDEPITLDLRASTRGRGYNPCTRKRGTEPQNSPLNYRRKSDDSYLNLETLIKHYKPYFGLLMSKLYNPKEPLRSSKLSKIKPRSLLGLLYQRKLNPTLPKSERLNLYNSGSKLNKLLLNINSNISDPILDRYPSLRTKILLSWNSIDYDITSEKIPQPEYLTEYKPLPNHYFNKFSELNLSKEKMTKYKEEYLKLKSMETKTE